VILVKRETLRFQDLP